MTTDKVLPYLDDWEFGQLSVPQKEEYLRLKEYEDKMLKFEALVAQSHKESTEAGRRAAEDYFNRHGQEAVLLRAEEFVRTHGGPKGSIYALGFRQRAYEFAGFTFEEATP